LGDAQIDDLRCGLVNACAPRQYDNKTIKFAFHGSIGSGFIALTPVSQRLEAHGQEPEKLATKHCSIHGEGWQKENAP
jgi:hypothetical protein